MANPRGDLCSFFIEPVEQTVHFSKTDLLDDLIVPNQALCLGYVQATRFGARNDVHLSRNTFIALFREELRLSQPGQEIVLVHQQS